MEIDKDLLSHLRGEKFSNSLRINLERSGFEGITREDAIIRIIKGTDVVHIGCTDHIPLIRQKIEANTWLHKLLTENSGSCIGVDIDRESVDFVVNELGYTNVICGNVLTDDLVELKARQWDYAVFGEIIEHLDNPVEFLKIFREKYGSNIKRFIITVPNVFNRKNLRNMLRYREEINSDHRYWFTPYTISKILVTAGYTPERISFASPGILSSTRLLLRRLYKLAGIKIKYPYYIFSSLIVTGNIE